MDCKGKLPADEAATCGLSGAARFRPEKPHKICVFSDISTDAGNWENRGLCRFYGLESVIREKEQQEH